MQYDIDNVIPIFSSAASVWLVTLDDGTKKILVWKGDANIYDVWYHLTLAYENFTVERVDSGEFDVTEMSSVYSGDTRKVTQDLDVNAISPQAGESLLELEKLNMPDEVAKSYLEGKYRTFGEFVAALEESKVLAIKSVLGKVPYMLYGGC